MRAKEHKRGLWHDAAWHLGGRVVSAMLSFGLFALIAGAYAPAQATTIFFFSFVFGFLIATFRTLHALAANLQGHDSRTARLRRAIVAAHRMSLLTPLALLVSASLFAAHPVGLQIISFATLMVVLCGYDADLVRATIGRGPALSLAIASGGILSIAYFASFPSPSVGVGAFAFLLQWVPVAALNFIIWGRIAYKRFRLRRSGTRASATAAMLGPFVVALFDGAALNAPFITSLTLEARSGLDLAIGTRLFVAALPLFPLITHWSHAGRLAVIARRLGLSEPVLYMLLQGLSGFLVGNVFALLFTLLSAQAVSVAAYTMFLGLLVAYVCHAVTARFASPRLSTRVRLIVYGGNLALLYGLLGVGVAGSPAQAHYIVPMQMATLIVAAVLATVLSRRIDRTDRPINHTAH